MKARPRSILAALAAALVTASVALAADPLDPKVKLNATDQARATAALIVRGDLGPGWARVAVKPQPLTLKSPVCPAYHPNNSDLTITGHAEAIYDLASSGIEVDTDVEILRTSRQVDVQFSRILQPKLGTCLRHNLLKSPGLAGTIIRQVKRVDLAKVGTHSALFRLSLTYKGLDLISDFMFLGQGRTEWFVNVTGPAFVERQLKALENRIARALVAHATV